jgi:hypothetical protein
MKITFLIAIITVLLLSQVTHSVTISLPVKKEVLVKVNLSIQRLQESLKHFSTPFENRVAIYNRVELTKTYLNQLRAELIKHNNVIAGAGNNIKGDKNIVIGNLNNVEGSNNWVFVSKFKGKTNGNLIIGKWRIQLDKTNLILTNPRFAISFLDAASNQPLKAKYVSKTR